MDNFTEKELDQIVAMVHSWVHGQKIDQRKITPAVRKFAKRTRIISQKNPTGLTWDFDTETDMPIKALFKAVKPMIERHSGFTITQDRAWNSLNLDRGSIPQIERILLKLDMAGFIRFQSAGNLWRIDIVEAK